MKKAALSSVLMAICIFAIAQVPESFSYQVVVRDGASNNPLTNQNVSFRMSILKGSSSGESQYSELHSANTGDLGIVNLVLGNGTDKSGNITTIGWGADIYFLKVEINKTGGSSYVEMGTTQLLSVPYALYARSVSSYPETDPNAVLLTGDQTVAGHKTFTGTTTVQPPVNATDAVTKQFVTFRVSIGDSLFLGPDQYVIIPGLSDANVITIKDIDNNTYRIKRIGTQYWMTENLKTTRFNDGSLISNLTDLAEWWANTTGAYVWYNNDEAAYKNIYGALYNWYAVNTGKLCPAGWHVPTDAEWVTLENYLIANGYNYDGTTTGNKIAKALGSTTNWDDSPNTGAVGNTDYPEKRNATGFTGLPGGFRTYVDSFREVGSYAYWWSSTPAASENYAWFQSMYTHYYDVRRNTHLKHEGYSVRCIRD